jgi:hypothetical protein
MIVDVCQRWTGRRDRYRPAGEPFDPNAYEVAPIEGDEEARAFVLEHHYSGSYPAARFRYGLYSRFPDASGSCLAGVAVFSVPMQSSVTTNYFEGHALEHVELGRFVLRDEVAGNAESWTIARCLELLRREGITGVISFSDPSPRRLPDGRGDSVQIFAGH